MVIVFPGVNTPPLLLSFYLILGESSFDTCG